MALGGGKTKKKTLVQMQETTIKHSMGKQLNPEKGETGEGEREGRVGKDMISTCPWHETINEAQKVHSHTKVKRWMGATADSDTMGVRFFAADDSKPGTRGAGVTGLLELILTGNKDRKQRERESK